jgi:hypothetical protein
VVALMVAFAPFALFGCLTGIYYGIQVASLVGLHQYSNPIRSWVGPQSLCSLNLCPLIEFLVRSRLTLSACSLAISVSSRWPGYSRACWPVFLSALTCVLWAAFKMQCLSYMRKLAWWLNFISPGLAESCNDADYTRLGRLVRGARRAFACAGACFPLADRLLLPLSLTRCNCSQVGPPRLP